MPTSPSAGDATPPAEGPASPPSHTPPSTPQALPTPVQVQSNLQPPPQHHTFSPSYYYYQYLSTPLPTSPVPPPPPHQQPGSAEASYQTAPEVPTPASSVASLQLSYGTPQMSHLVLHPHTTTPPSPIQVFTPQQPSHPPQTVAYAPWGMAPMMPPASLLTTEALHQQPPTVDAAVMGTAQSVPRISLGLQVPQSSVKKVLQYHLLVLALLVVVLALFVGSFFTPISRCHLLFVRTIERTAKAKDYVAIARVAYAASLQEYAMLAPCTSFKTHACTILTLAQVSSWVSEITSGLQAPFGQLLDISGVSKARIRACSYFSQNGTLTPGTGKVVATGLPPPASLHERDLDATDLAFRRVPPASAVVMNGPIKAMDGGGDEALLAMATEWERLKNSTGVLIDTYSTDPRGLKAAMVLTCDGDSRLAPMLNLTTALRVNLTEYLDEDGSVNTSLIVSSASIFRKAPLPHLTITHYNKTMSTCSDYLLRCIDNSNPFYVVVAPSSRLYRCGGGTLSAVTALDGTSAFADVTICDVAMYEVGADPYGTLAFTVAGNFAMNLILESSDAHFLSNSARAQFGFQPFLITLTVSGGLLLACVAMMTATAVLVPIHRCQLRALSDALEKDAAVAMDILYRAQGALSAPPMPPTASSGTTATAATDAAGVAGAEHSQTSVNAGNVSSGSSPSTVVRFVPPSAGTMQLQQQMLVMPVPMPMPPLMAPASPTASPAPHSSLYTQPSPRAPVSASASQQQQLPMMFMPPFYPAAGPGLPVGASGAMLVVAGPPPAGMQDRPPSPYGEGHYLVPREAGDEEEMAGVEAETSDAACARAADPAESAATNEVFRARVLDPTSILVATVDVANRDHDDGADSEMSLSVRSRDAHGEALCETGLSAPPLPVPLAVTCDDHTVLREVDGPAAAHTPSSSAVAPSFDIETPSGKSTAGTKAPLELVRGSSTARAQVHSVPDISVPVQAQHPHSPSRSFSTASAPSHPGAELAADDGSAARERHGNGAARTPHHSSEASVAAASAFSQPSLCSDDGVAADVEDELGSSLPSRSVRSVSQPSRGSSMPPPPPMLTATQQQLIRDNPALLSALAASPVPAPSDAATRRSVLPEASAAPPAAPPLLPVSATTDWMFTRSRHVVSEDVLEESVAAASSAGERAPHGPLWPVRWLRDPLLGRRGGGGDAASVRGNWPGSSSSSDDDDDAMPGAGGYAGPESSPGERTIQLFVLRARKSYARLRRKQMRLIKTILTYEKVGALLALVFAATAAGLQFSSASPAVSSRLQQRGDDVLHWRGQLETPHLVLISVALAVLLAAVILTFVTQWRKMW